MVDFIPEEIVQEFYEAFRMFDKDGDGTIDIPEFVRTLQSLGQDPSPKEIEDMMKVIDANGDGLIDFDEFKHLMYLKMKESDGGDDVKELFSVLDIDKSGYFTASELHKVILSLGDNISYEEAAELVDSIETKEPGKVNYDEFCGLVSQLLSASVR